MKCNKCNIEKDISEFSTYWHSTQQKQRTRKYCKSCFSIQQKEVKLRIKLKKLNPFENHPDYSKCSICNEWKHKQNDFYTWKTSRKQLSTKCKKCFLEHDRQKRLERKNEKLKEYGGSEGVRAKPGEYWDEYQKENVSNFSMMIDFSNYLIN